MQPRFEKVADLPPVLGRASSIRPSVDSSGAPLLACSLRGPNGGSTADRQSAGRGRAVLSILRFDGEHWQEVLDAETPLVDPHVQPLSAGGMLVAGTRSLREPDGRAELNGWIYDSGGTEQGRILLGDGIEDVQVTPLDEIWVSYLDAGTTGDLGSHGWGRLNPETWIDPIGSAGVARFTVEGVREYEFRPPAGYAVVTDCYALNASSSGVWLCYHPGFPLVRVGEGVRGWRTGEVAADAIAVAGSTVMLHAGYGSQRGTCWLGQIGEGSDVELEQVKPVLASGGLLGEARWVLGRGPALHAVGDAGWQVLDLSEA